MELPDDQYRLLVEAAPMLVWRAGLDTKCDYFNATWLEFTGRTMEQELGNGWVEGVHADDLERCLDVYLGSFAARRSFEMEYRLRRFDGVHRWILDRGVPFHRNGEFAGFIGSCVDVHERRDADEAKTTFLSMLTHELRTPLQPLVLCSQQLERLAGNGQPVPLPVVERIKRQVDRLCALVERAGRGMDVSRGMATARQLGAVDLVQLVAEVVEERRQVAHARGAAAELRHAGFVGTPRSIVADAMLLAQALDILVDNALKYSPYGGTITVELVFEPSVVRIVVEDEGIGIPSAELPRVGAPYFRASNVSSRQYPGLGLGVAVARDIVTAHGGTLVLARRGPEAFGAAGQAPGGPPQTGTRAVIELPLAEGGGP